MDDVQIMKYVIPICTFGSVIEQPINGLAHQPHFNVVDANRFSSGTALKALCTEWGVSASKVTAGWAYRIFAAVLISDDPSASHEG